LCDEAACKIALQTWERRLGDGAGLGRSEVQELLLPAYTLAFLLDPLYAQVSKDSEDVSLPQVPWAHEKAAQELVAPVGGKDALDDLQALQMDGWSVDMCGEVIVCAGKTEITGARTPCTTNHVAAVQMRKRFWKRFGHTRYPFLSDVAQRVMSVHKIWIIGSALVQLLCELDNFVISQNSMNEVELSLQHLSKHLNTSKTENKSAHKAQQTPAEPQSWWDSFGTSYMVFL
jgi:hypothetical protein